MTNDFDYWHIKAWEYQWVVFQAQYLFNGSYYRKGMDIMEIGKENSTFWGVLRVWSPSSKFKPVALLLLCLSLKMHKKCLQNLSDAQWSTKHWSGGHLNFPWNSHVAASPGKPWHLLIFQSKVRYFHFFSTDKAVKLAFFDFYSTSDHY